MASPLEVVLTVVGGGAGLKLLELAAKWLDARSSATRAADERADAAASKHAERDHAFGDKLVALLEAQNAASAARVDQYVTAIGQSTEALHEMAAAINDLAARVDARDGRSTPAARPVRVRSLTPAPAPTSPTQPPAPPVTGEHPVGAR